MEMAQKVETRAQRATVNAAAHRVMDGIAPALLAGAITTLLVIVGDHRLITYTPLVLSAAIIGTYVAGRVARVASRAKHREEA